MDKKEIVITLGDQLVQFTLAIFQKIGQLLDDNLPEQSLIYYERNKYGDFVPGVNLDNSDTVKLANSSNSKQREDEEMRRIDKIKNARIRTDGRYEWRKMINGVKYQIIDSNLERLNKKVSQLQKELKSKLNKKLVKPNLKLSHLVYSYYDNIILGEVKTKRIKQESAIRYHHVLKNFDQFGKDITQYTKDDIVKFLFNITEYRTGAYCYFLIKRVFADEFEKGTIKTNPIINLKNPFSQRRCGNKKTWLNINEQQILKQNLNDSIFSKEILFYLLTGCRLDEAFTAEINFEQHIAKINRHKTEYSGVKTTYIPLSQKFCDYIKNDWNKMFKITPHAMATKISRFFKKIGIKNKTTHSLRHTFSSNLYYLGADPKRQQYLMGHSTIKLTYEIYTTLDITIKKDDILNIWGDLYPEF